ncbi:DUF4097 family beta strand repeat-containing protein [Streptomyces sp. NPDC051018]|uniref:DUF4097 family beta strand repeat-containing protein n=1 Tax=Streptomyces sp. NPDC051018 TaxID=3365639 RepID=UPI00378C1C04
MTGILSTDARPEGRHPVRGRTVRGRAGRVAVAVGGGGALVFALTGCGSADAQEAPEERKSFALDAKSLHIDSDNSALEIVPADVKAVEVTRQVDGWVMLGSGPEKSWRLEGGTLKLRLSCDGVASECEARHVVKVPRGVAVTVKSGHGDVTASGFATPMKIRADNGNVTVRGTDGPLDLATDHGDLVTDGVTARTVKAQTDNGDIRVALKAGTAADRIETVNGNGGITIELARGKTYAVTAATDNGSAQVDVANDRTSKHVVTARSDNGDVDIRNAG